MSKHYTGLLLSAVLSGLALAVASTAEAQTPAPATVGWEVPRTADGHPDLQGNWTNVWITPIQREEGRGPVFTPEEVAELEEPSGDCPASPGTLDCGRGGGQVDASLSGVEYNEVYWDRGSRVAVVNGEPRTSLITRPSNGRRPPLTAEGERRLQAERDFRSQFGPYDHPELRPIAERCVVSFGSNAGPPMLPNGAYNNNYTIVQTPDHVMIMTEMIHDTRIIRIGDGPRLPPHIRPWFGDSWGRWEGETLVVETTNLSPRQSLLGIPPSEQMKVIERFRRVDEETILYEFTVEDPVMYSQAWGGEVPFARLNDRLYEYACHEGNYSLPAVLSGARSEESERS
ncbi:MAG: hypothetical protein GEU90_16615 [Gemmatimonas sp.]|nr:hypothetical protein [Gemmatimonas sp.]